MPPSSWKNHFGFAVIAILSLIYICCVYCPRFAHEFYPCEDHYKLEQTIQQNPVVSVWSNTWPRKKDTWNEGMVNPYAIEKIQPIACRLLNAGCTLAKLYTYHADAHVSFGTGFSTGNSRIYLQVDIKNETSAIATMDCRSSTTTLHKTMKPVLSETDLFFVKYVSWFLFLTPVYLAFKMF
jgi:hypothetical protein